MAKEKIQFDVEKLNKSDREYYDSLNDEKKTVFEKQWCDIEEQKMKLRQKQARLNDMKNAQKEAERKARTHHLVEVGALVEKYFGKIENMEMLEDYLKKYENGFRKHKESYGKINLDLLNHRSAE